MRWMDGVGNLPPWERKTCPEAHHSFATARLGVGAFLSDCTIRGESAYREPFSGSSILAEIYDLLTLEKIVTRLTIRNPDDETFITLLVEAEGIVNSRPLTYVPLESETQEALTPNHFLLLSSQGVTQPPISIPDRPECLRTNWRLTTNLIDQFWSRWVREYLPTIANRTKWYGESKEPNVGDLAVIVDASVRNGWLRGRIVSVVKGRDGRSRQVLVHTSAGVLRRPMTKVAILDIMKPNDYGVGGNAAPSKSLEMHYGSGMLGRNYATVPR
ncbi:uncharacterized protein LOC134204010 [Armigeres subalbatus]|uniref:uncharacterized protein LOC134204010 n=1 Tax=Armigeres subalbatus TaxID=124917 RepID=UPI002ED549F5